MTAALWARMRYRRRTSAAGRVRRWVASVLGAVSDHQDVQAACQPAACGPVRVASVVAHRVPIAPASLLEATHAIPPIVPNALAHRPRRIPGIKEPIRRAAAQAVTGNAAPRQRQRVVRKPFLMPESNPPGHPEGPIGPDEQDPRDPLHGSALLAGEDPRQAFHRGRTGLGKDGIIEDQIPLLPDEHGATGTLQESVPGPVGLQHPCQAVMRHHWQGLSYGDTARRGAIIQQGGEVRPHERWQRVPSFVAVGWVL